MATGFINITNVWASRYKNTSVLLNMDISSETRSYLCISCIEPVEWGNPSGVLIFETNKVSYDNKAL